MFQPAIQHRILQMQIGSRTDECPSQGWTHALRWAWRAGDRMKLSLKGQFLVIWFFSKCILMLIPLMIIKTAVRSNLTVENITIALSFLLLTDIPVGKCDETRPTARSKSSPFQCWFNSRAVQRPWNHVKMNQCAELKWWIHTNQNKTSTWNMICRSCLPLLFQLQLRRTLLDGSAQGKGK